MGGTSRFLTQLLLAVILIVSLVIAQMPFAKSFISAVVGIGYTILIPPAFPAEQSHPITFNKNFEAGSLGRIEQTAEGQYRRHVEGQSDERGRNRQANWYYFRIDGVKGRKIALTLTDFVGEYNDKPGAVAMNADTVPVYSFDNEHWQHFPAMEWDDQKKEATLHFQFDR